MTDIDQRIESTTQLLLATCQERDFRLSGDLAVCEQDAAELLGYSTCDALRKQASEGTTRIPYRLLGNRRLYRIRDLATDIERNYG